MPTYTPKDLSGIAEHLRARIARRRSLGYRRTEVTCDELERLLNRVAPAIAFDAQLATLSDCLRRLAKVKLPPLQAIRQ